MTDIVTWSETASSNNATPPNGFPEGMSPASLNDAAREVMGAVKRSWDRMNPTLTSTGSSNAYALSYTVAPVAYATGEVFRFIPNFTNTGAATLNVNSLGATSILQSDGATAIPANAITSGYVTAVYYNGSAFVLINSFAFTGDATGNGSGSVALTLANSGVTAGVYGNLTIDAKGRITAARAAVGGDLTGILGTAAFVNTGTSGGTVPLLNAANTFSGITTFSAEVDLSNTGGSALVLSGNAATARAIFFATLSGGTKSRWAMVANTTAEGGSNAGSDFQIIRYADAGTLVDAPLAINRATGAVTILNALAASSTIVATGTITGSSLIWGSNTVGTNAIGARTVEAVSAGVPTGGSNGDIHYQY